DGRGAPDCRDRPGRRVERCRAAIAAGCAAGPNLKLRSVLQQGRSLEPARSSSYLSQSMFDELSEKLEATFARLRGKGVLTEADVKDGMREVRRVLLEADVNFALTREFLERVEKKAVGLTALKTVSPAQQLVKIVHDELTTMLGERREGLKLSSVPPTIVLMVGLQGSGKTTTAAKLARKLKAENRAARLVA